MPDTLDALEADRSDLLEEFLRLGDLRPGSITAVVRRCGKASCVLNQTIRQDRMRICRRNHDRFATFTEPRGLMAAGAESPTIRHLLEWYRTALTGSCPNFSITANSNFLL